MNDDLAHKLLYEALSNSNKKSSINLFIKSARLFKNNDNRFEFLSSLESYFKTIDKFNIQPISEFKEYYEIYKKQGDSGLDYYLFNRKKVIIETDIGFDPDDIIALTMALKSSNIKIELIVASEEKNGYRASIINELLNYFGVNIPIVAGPDTDNNFRIFKEKQMNVARNYINKMKQLLNKNHIYYVNLSSLTNLSHFIDFAGVPDNMSLIQMGGSSFKKEHNFNLDFKSAHHVLSSGIKIKLITSEITNQQSLLIDNFSPFYQSLTNNPIHSLIKDNIDYFLSNIYPAFMLHDPLTISTILNPAFIAFKKGNVNFNNGFNSYELNPKSSIELSVNADYDSFMKYVIKTI